MAEPIVQHVRQDGRPLCGEKRGPRDVTLRSMILTMRKPRLFDPGVILCAYCLELTR